MGEPVTGGCLCGAVRFRFEGPALVQRACWCRDCQYLASGNATVNMMIRREGFSCTGALATYDSAADSGTPMRRSFCPTCGTPLFSEALTRPEALVVRVGALDDPELGRPTAFIWTGSAPRWGLVDASLPNCEGQPGPIGK